MHMPFYLHLNFMLAILALEVFTGTRSKYTMQFLFLNGCLLEFKAPLKGTSDEHPQDTFLVEI